MAPTIEELIMSRPGTVDDVRIEGSGWRLLYLVKGTSSETTAMNLLRATAPAALNGLPRQRCDVTPIYVDTADGSDIGYWKAEAQYGARVAPDRTGATTTLSFDTTGGTQHVTVSRDTNHLLAKTGATDPVPDYEQLIGWNGEEAEGCDIVVPKLTFTLKRQIPMAKWTPAYFGKIADLTGKINSAAFTITVNQVAYQFLAQEVLFLGGRGDETQNAEYVEVEYQFAVSRRQTFAADAIKGFPEFTKEGWEYMWVAYKKDEDTAAHIVVGRPFAIYLESVYETGTFTDLEP